MVTWGHRLLTPKSQASFLSGKQIEMARLFPVSPCAVCTCTCPTMVKQFCNKKRRTSLGHIGIINLRLRWMLNSSSCTVPVGQPLFEQLRACANSADRHNLQTVHHLTYNTTALIEEGFIQKRGQMSSLLFWGGQNWFNSLPHYRFSFREILRNGLMNARRKGVACRIYSLVRQQVETWNV